MGIVDFAGNGKPGGGTIDFRDYDILTVTSLPTASEDTLEHIYQVGPDATNNYDRYYTQKNPDDTYSWVPMGSTQMDLSDYATGDDLAQLEHEIGNVTEVQNYNPNSPNTENWYWKAADGCYAVSGGWYTIFIPLESGRRYSIQGSTISGYNSKRFFATKPIVGVAITPETDPGLVFTGGGNLNWLGISFTKLQYDEGDDKDYEIIAFGYGVKEALDVLKDTPKFYDAIARIDNDIYSVDEPIDGSTTLSDTYINLSGQKVTNNGFSTKEYDVSGLGVVYAEITIYSGSSVSAISGFDANGNFVRSFAVGTASETVVRTSIIDCDALGITKVSLSGDNGHIDSASVYKLIVNAADREARKDILSLENAIYTERKSVPVLQSVSGSYVKSPTGEITENAGFSYKSYNVAGMGKVNASATITGGIVVAVISGFDTEDNLVEIFAIGTASDTVLRSAIIDCDSLGIVKLIVSTDNSHIDTCSVFEYVAATEKGVTKVQTWGDSITAAGEYQLGLADTLAISISDIKNAGISSDFSMNVRYRFVSYFTEETPYVGTGTYSIPSFSERQKELEDCFFVFWFGTNNLINQNRAASSLTTGSAAYNALQPNPDFKYDRLYSRSYIDMMFNDIRQVVNILPHKNFAIIGGHGGFMGESEMRTKMLELDAILARMYPRNYIDVRELVNLDYDFQDVRLGADFIKPALNGTVTIELNKTGWIGQNGNTSNNICIGTKSIYDKYNVLSVIDETHISAKLIESNTEFVEGDTIRAEYLLVTDLGRDAVNMQTRVYSYEDCVSFGLMSFPRSSSDPLHFTDAQYRRIGQLIGYEIQKMKLI